MMNEDQSHVYFVTRPSHRLRQLESIVHCPPSVRVVGQYSAWLKSQESRLYSKRGSTKAKMKRLAAQKLLPVHFQRPGAVPREASLLYLWGAFPLWSSRVPYIIELDNPYVLTYYNVAQFRALRGLLRSMLLSQRCQRIICISKACQENLVAELGDDLRAKSSVVYPYVAPGLFEKKSSQVDIPTFLFVANDFFLKGGREILHVFQKLNQRRVRARLRMVTTLPPECTHFLNYNWLEIATPGMDRAVLMQDYFAQADVLIHPTYQDSFGMVVLEALANTIPVIATDVYAIPEILGSPEDCLSPPLRYFDDACCACAEHWSMGFEGRIRRSVFVEFEQALFQQVVRALDLNWRREATERLAHQYATTFTPALRSAAFEAAIMGVPNA